MTKHISYKEWERAALKRERRLFVGKAMVYNDSAKTGCLGEAK